MNADRTLSDEQYDWIVAYERHITPHAVLSVRTPAYGRMPPLQIPTFTGPTPKYFVYDGNVEEVSGQLIKDPSDDTLPHHYAATWTCSLFTSRPPSDPAWPRDAVMQYDSNWSPYHRVPMRYFPSFMTLDSDLLGPNDGFWPLLHRCAGFRLRSPWRFPLDVLAAGIGTTVSTIRSPEKTGALNTVEGLLRALGWKYHHLSGLRPQHVEYCMSVWSLSFTRADLDVIDPASWFDGLLRSPIYPDEVPIGLNCEQITTHPFVLLNWIRVQLMDNGC
uniref:Nonstructural protein NS31 n=1 Tax=Grass carp hemorrhagic virus TaxID=128986 RepID=Q9IH19_GCRV|nr:nonstructural protein NS31 [Grass carp hemorrhagic virus]